jgi:hypothetical protein
MLKRVLNKNDLKSFIYNFFVIWNSFLIIFLLLLIFYPSKTKKTEQIPKGEFKLKLSSLKKFQNIGENLFSIASIPLSKNLIVASKEGIISQLNNQNFSSIFILSFNQISKNIKTFNDYIIFSTENELFLLNSLGKKIWHLNFNQEIKNFNILYNKKNFYIVVSTPNTLYTITKNGKVFKKFLLNQLLFSEIISYDFNNDSFDDIIIGTTENIYLLDGRTLNILWEKSINSIYPGKFSLLKNKNELYIIVPLYNGKILVLNKYGLLVWETEANSQIVSAPVSFKNIKNELCFIQKTLDNKILFFNFTKRKKENEISFEKPFELCLADLNFNNSPEIITVTEDGIINIIENQILIDKFNLYLKENEKIISNIIADDIDKDGKAEIIFSSNKGNVYAISYYVKIGILKTIFKKINRWYQYGGDERNLFKFN